MVNEEWINYVGRRWGIGTGKECDLEAAASNKVKRQALADVEYDEEGFNFDEAIMPENADDLSEEELIEVLARYEADYLTGGEGDRYYDPQTKRYTLPPFWLARKGKGVVMSAGEEIAIEDYLADYPGAVVDEDNNVFISIDDYLLNPRLCCDRFEELL